MPNYFLDINFDDWSIKTAFKIIEEYNPRNVARDNLRLLKAQLSEVLKSNDYSLVSEATKLLQGWKNTRREPIPKRKKAMSEYKENSYVAITVSHSSRVVINKYMPGPQASPLTSCSTGYTEEDFSSEKVLATLVKFGKLRSLMSQDYTIQTSIQGSQLRKYLSEDIHKVKLSYSSESARVSVKIVASLLYKLTDSCNTSNHTQGEATLIIECIRPFLNHCILSQLEDAKREWLTYRFLLPSDGKAMIPDLVLFLETNSATNYELLFVEVKRKGRYCNSALENDLVKLGKEMHTALNKLIKKKASNSGVAGLLIEDTKAVAYKMTLKYDGLYQMVEVSRFHFPRNSIDDVLLIPSIIEKLFQLKEIVSATINSIYKSIDSDEDSADLRPYVRKACKTPASILAE